MWAKYKMKREAWNLTDRERVDVESFSINPRQDPFPDNAVKSSTIWA